MAIGILEAAAWILGIETPLRARGVVPMQFNTAVCLTVSGAALLALVASPGKALIPVRTGAVLVGLLAALTLLQEPTGIDLGVDRLLFDSPASLGASHPGRMAPSAALGSLFVALALIALASRRGHEWGARAASVGASVIAVLAGVPLVGHIVGLQTAYAWGTATQMAVATSLGFLVLAAGLAMLDTARALRAGNGALERYLPFAGFATLATGTVLLWVAIVQNAERHVLSETKAQAELVRQAAKGRLEEDLRDLVRLARKWDSMGVPRADEWDADARDFLGHTIAASEIAWISDDGLMRLCSGGASATNRPCSGSSLRATFPRLATAQDGEGGRSPGARFFENPSPLGGSEGLYAIAAVHGRGARKGTLVVRYDIAALAEAFAGPFLDDHAVVFNGLVLGDVDANSVAEEGPARRIRDGHEGVSLDIELPGISWRLDFTPMGDAVSLSLGGLDKILLVTGLGLALVLASATRFLLSTRARERELAMASRRISAITETASDAIVTCDDRGRIVQFNGAASRIFDIPAASALGRPLEDLMPERFHAAHASGMARFLSTRKGNVMGKTVELAGMRHGNEFPLELSLAVWEGPEVTYFTGIMRDITDRKRDEAMLRAQEERLALALDASGMGTWEWDLRTGRMTWSERAEQLFGLAPGGFEGTLDHFGALIHPDEREHAAVALADAVRTRTDYDIELRSQPPADGAAGSEGGARAPGRWLAARGRLHYDADGSPTRVIGTVADIDARRKARDEIIAAREAALEASRLKSEFLANVSHEIRTPLNGVLGLTELLLDTGLDAVQRDHASGVRVSAEGLLAIVNDILDFSKADAGRVEFEDARFDLLALVHGVESMFAGIARAKGLDFTLAARVPPGRAVVRGDAGRVRQVLCNLVGNAVKFTDAGSVTLEVECDPEESGRVRFTVTDTGIGISEESLAKLFRPFTQADASTTRRFGGTGLGLSIAKKFAEGMGGTVGASSLEGEGSVFWFHVPLPSETRPAAAVGASGASDAAREAAPAPEAARLSGGPTEAIAAVSAAVSTGGAKSEGVLAVAGPSAPGALEGAAGARVLVVEDNPINQKVALALLAKHGHKGVAVANGREALDALAVFPYDLVLMDCQMPVMDGYEATRRLRASGIEPGSTIPVIAMTANALPSDRERCMASGMDDFLAKPVRGEELRSAVERWYGRHGGSRGAA